MHFVPFSFFFGPTVKSDNDSIKEIKLNTVLRDYDDWDRKRESRGMILLDNF